MKKKLAALLPVFLLAFSAFYPYSAPAYSAPTVPVEYQPVATYLDTQLNVFTSGVSPSSAATRFGGDLFIASSERGDSLLTSTAYISIDLTLDRMQALGVQGVTLDISEYV